MTNATMAVGRPPQGNSNKNSHAPRILFVGEAVSLAHVGRPAILARWAQAAGYDVAFACGFAFKKIAEGEGLQPLPIETIDLKTFYGCLDEGRFFYDHACLDAYVAAERKLIRSWQPDLVVGDFRLSLSVSAKLEKVPMLSLINAHWSPGHPCRIPAPRAGLFRYCSPGLRDGIFSLVRPLVFRYFARALDALRKRNGLAPLHDLRRLYTAGDACAYLDLPELLSMPQVPRNHFYLGPLVWTPKDVRPLDLEALDPRRPLAYVSMGSTGEKRVVPEILKALEATGFNAVLTGMDAAWGRDWLRRHSAFKGRLVCTRFLDPDAVLKRATVCICHGGSGTVYQSLRLGVPLMCLPRNPDQGVIAQALMEAGAGFSVHPEGAHAACVGNILREHFLESNNISEGAGSLARVVNIWNTRQRWTNWLASQFNRQSASAGWKSTVTGGSPFCVDSSGRSVRA